MELTRRSLGVIALLVLVVTAGCSGGGGVGQQSGGDGADFAASGGGGGGEATKLAATATPMAEGTPVARDESVEDDGSGAAVRQARARILTGHVVLEVEDFGAARRNLSDAVSRQGGFVSDARQQLHRVHNETYTTGVVVLRVPRDNFSALMSGVEAEGTVLRTEQNSRDVTDQLVDIEARLENLRAERDRLRTLYERANTTRDILDVQERLSDVQGQIERLEARQQSLERQVALSTITVELEEPRPEPDRIGPDEWYDTGILAAFLESVNGVVLVIRATVVAVAFALPYVLVFGTPIAAAAFVIRRRRNDRSFGK